MTAIRRVRAEIELRFDHRALPLAKRLPVGDEELEVARIGLVDGGIVDLVQDARLSVNHTRQLVW
jgi:hypothetical protein